MSYNRQAAKELDEFIEQELKEFPQPHYDKDSIYEAVYSVLQLSPEEKFVTEVIARHAARFLAEEIEYPCEHSPFQPCGCQNSKTRRELIYG